MRMSVEFGNNEVAPQNRQSPSTARVGSEFFVLEEKKKSKNMETGKLKLAV